MLLGCPVAVGVGLTTEVAVRVGLGPTEVGVRVGGGAGVVGVGVTDTRDVGVRVAVGVALPLVGVGVGGVPRVAVAVLVEVGVTVAVGDGGPSGVSVGVAVKVCVAVGVAVGTCTVDVALGLPVGVAVGVRVDVLVLVGVKRVPVAVGVEVFGVTEAVGVRVAVGVVVGVSLGVGVGVTDGPGTGVAVGVTDGGGVWSEQPLTFLTGSDFVGPVSVSDQSNQTLTGPPLYDIGMGTWNLCWPGISGLGTVTWISPSLDHCFQSSATCCPLPSLTGRYQLKMSILVVASSHHRCRIHGSCRSDVLHSQGPACVSQTHGLPTPPLVGIGAGAPVGATVTVAVPVMGPVTCTGSRNSVAVARSGVSTRLAIATPCSCPGRSPARGARTASAPNAAVTMAASIAALILSNTILLLSPAFAGVKTAAETTGCLPHAANMRLTTSSW